MSGGGAWHGYARKGRGLRNRGSERKEGAQGGVGGRASKRGRDSEGGAIREKRGTEFSEERGSERGRFSRGFKAKGPQ